MLDAEGQSGREAVATMGPMPDRVRITDVAPRDGLQNERAVIPAADKVRLLELLADCGIDEIEATSFVSAKWVPQLGDAAEVLERYGKWAREAWGQSRPTALPMVSALVPNEKGMEGLEAAEADGGARVEKVAVFTAASETFAQKNTNASIAQTLERFGAVIARARARHTLVRGYVSCAIACPFEGPIDPAKVADVCVRLAQLGVDELDVADTIGAGTPESVGRMLRVVNDAVGPQWADRQRLTLHLHDTYGRAAECVRTAVREGVRSFDGAVGGLGGCPYASTPTQRAPGNIDTLTLVRTLRAEGLECDADEDRLEAAGRFARELVRGKAGRS